LLEPELISNNKIIVVGGGDSAVESAMLLMENNEVTLSYRKEKFARIKPKNLENITKAIDSGKINVLYNSNLVEIKPDEVEISISGKDENQKLANDKVYIFAGGELPIKFLENAGITVDKTFGKIVKKY
ncbi:MAG: NAD(P)-binding domain-containing protein, partial [Bacteroidia bacterium]